VEFDTLGNKHHRDLGYCYRKGHGVAIDCQVEINHYKMVGDKVDYLAINNSDYIHHHGLGVPVNYIFALKWYDRADSVELGFY
jgi:TPR repeat protein